MAASGCVGDPPDNRANARRAMCVAIRRRGRPAKTTCRGWTGSFDRIERCTDCRPFTEPGIFAPHELVVAQGCGPVRNCTLSLTRVQAGIRMVCGGRGRVGERTTRGPNSRGSKVISKSYRRCCRRGDGRRCHASDSDSAALAPGWAGLQSIIHCTIARQLSHDRRLPGEEARGVPVRLCQEPQGKPRS